MADDLRPLVLVEEDDEESDNSDDDEMHSLEDADARVDDEDVEGDEVPNVTYDPSIAGTHSYLGNDLEDVRGRTVHDDGSYLSLPIISLPGVVLVPGQTLPLHLFHPSTVALIQRVVEEDKTFGLVTSRIHQADNLRSSNIGTTAEIFSIKNETDEPTGITTVRVKATGRQRFEIKETRRTMDGNIMARVRIMPERVLSDFLDGVRPRSRQRLGICCTDFESKSGLDYSAGDHAAALKRFIETTKNNRRRLKRLSTAYLTSWPPWVYRQYNVHYLMQCVREELASWNQTLKPEQMPSDPTDLSFWVASNLPLDDNLKIYLLTIDSAIQRLRCELSIMQRCAVMFCRDCQRLIANKKDVFSMAVEGPMGAYVNPGGHVHEMLTVYKAQNVILVGRPSTEHSWFPGYAWTILQCRFCSSHMGWKFTATDKKLQPSKFWGLCRGSLLPGIQNDEDETTEDEWKPVV